MTEAPPSKAFTPGLRARGFQLGSLELLSLTPRLVHRKVRWCTKLCCATASDQERLW